VLLVIGCSLCWGGRPRAPWRTARWSCWSWGGSGRTVRRGPVCQGVERGRAPAVCPPTQPPSPTGAPPSGTPTPPNAEISVGTTARPGRFDLGSAPLSPGLRRRARPHRTGPVDPRARCARPGPALRRTRSQPGGPRRASLRTTHPITGQ